MTDQLISFETAKLAKEKGFIEGSKSYYKGDGEIHSFDPEFHPYAIHKNNFMQRFLYEASTQSLLQKWLREEHKIQVWVTYHYPINGKYLYVLMFKNGVGVQNTYEEALEVALQEALKLINNG
jgi:hypothetical protein